jgi:hypothetical protein
MRVGDWVQVDPDLRAQIMRLLTVDGVASASLHVYTRHASNRSSRIGWDDWGAPYRWRVSSGQTRALADLTPLLVPDVARWEGVAAVTWPQDDAAERSPRRQHAWPGWT